MRRLVLVLVALMLVSQAMADVTISISDNGDGTADINYSNSGTAASGFGLDLSVSAGTIVSVTPAIVGESAPGNLGYGIFPESFALYIDANSPNFGVAGYTCVASSTSLPASSCTIELGALFVAGGEPTSGTLATVEVSADCTLTITANAARNGVILTDGTAGGNLPVAGGVTMGGGCYTGPDQAAWTSLGEPTQWCNIRQCNGDADAGQDGDPKNGYFWVWSSDLTELLAGWKQPYVNPTSSDWIRADFDHAQEGDPKGGYFRVWSNDLTILLANWKSTSVGTNCQTP